MRDLNAPDVSLGVVGAGAMGTGIAEVAAAGGVDVLLFDTRTDAAAKAREGIAGRLSKRVDQGKLSQGEVDQLVARIRPVKELDEFCRCDIVIEAVIEDRAVKIAVFENLENIVGEDTVLASNTSSLPIGVIAAELRRPDRIAGMHFFNPVPLMKLVEVIPGPDTDKGVVEALHVFSHRLGRTPVLVKDTPGFLVNLGGRAYATEALTIRHENVATPAEIDAVMRDGFGFRMGPFELMDLTGIDVNFPVTRFIHDSAYGDPRLRSTPEHRYLMETGRFGRKSGRGFFDYGDGSGMPSADTTSDAVPAERAYVHGDACALTDLATECGALVVHADDGASLILAAPVGEDASAYSARNKLDHRRLVCVDMIPDTARRVTLMSAPGVDAAIRDSAIALFATKRKVTTIADSPGFIGQRIASMIANLGCEMAQTGLASTEGIDLAMRLGLNYPKGPLEIADAIGTDTVFRILTAIQNLSGDDRYRPSQWLRRRAMLGLSARQA